MIAFAVGWLVGMLTRGLITQRWSRTHTLVAVAPLLVVLLFVFRPSASVYDGCQALEPYSWLWWLNGCFLP